MGFTYLKLKRFRAFLLHKTENPGSPHTSQHSPQKTHQPPLLFLLHTPKYKQPTPRHNWLNNNRTSSQKSQATPGQQRNRTKRHGSAWDTHTSSTRLKPTLPRPYTHTHGSLQSKLSRDRTARTHSTNQTRLGRKERTHNTSNTAQAQNRAAKLKPAAKHTSPRTDLPPKPTSQGKHWMTSQAPPPSQRPTRTKTAQE